MSQTQLTIVNGTDEKIKLYLTLGATLGCIQDVKDIPFITGHIPDNNLQGYFELDRKGKSDRVKYTPPLGMGINGNVTLDGPPINCADVAFPSGVNLAEFILNNSFQSGNPQETIDISCVPGANALFEFSMQGGGNWNAGSLDPNVTSFENGSLGNNLGKVGVFPFGCDDCTRSVKPPHCSNPPQGAPNPPIPQSSPICNVQRSASSSGGTVTITLKGRY